MCLAGKEKVVCSLHCEPAEVEVLGMACFWHYQLGSRSSRDDNIRRRMAKKGQSCQGSTACLLLDLECERQQDRKGMVYTISLMKALPAKDANGRNKWKAR